MKLIHLHPTSLIIGLTSGMAALLLTSQTGTPSFPAGRVEVGPHPRDMVHIREGAPYTVPAGKILTITGVGHVDGITIQPQFKVQLLVNGQNATAAYETAGWGSATILPVPPGLTARWGEVVSVVTDPTFPSTNGAIALGYLADR